MNKNTSYNKVIFLSVIGLILFLYQYTLGIVGIVILAHVISFMLYILLDKWFKDNSTRTRDKFIIGIISLLIIASTLFHSLDYAGPNNYIIRFWMVSISVFIVWDYIAAAIGSIYKRIKKILFNAF
jgi:hypothetical protein